jgi:hypothetical protein
LRQQACLLSPTAGLLCVPALCAFWCAVCASRTLCSCTCIHSLCVHCARVFVSVCVVDDICGTRP